VEGCNPQGVYLVSYLSRISPHSVIAEDENGESTIFGSYEQSVETYLIPFFCLMLDELHLNIPPALKVLGRDCLPFYEELEKQTEHKEVRQAIEKVRKNVRPEGTY
jgi:hypothetical protein